MALPSGDGSGVAFPSLLRPGSGRKIVSTNAG